MIDPSSEETSKIKIEKTHRNGIYKEIEYHKMVQNK